MKRIVQTLCRLLGVFASLAIVAGCASLHGARLISPLDETFKISIEYRAEGLSEKCSFKLVTMENGPAILVQWADEKKRFLIERAWSDVEGDHFIFWKDAYIFFTDLGVQSDSLEFVVPPDRSSPTKVYAHNARRYIVVESNGIKRPVVSGAKSPPAFLLFPITSVVPEN